ncbi:MAG: hypothetical protein BWY63_03471 [Chloroflexi bacterium ADurb.Bin360]|nr:MAG: hypothetical protein BWY63_03471 [Chloroflexi bacterium ADurb.Bin360]
MPLAHLGPLCPQALQIQPFGRSPAAIPGAGFAAQARQNHGDIIHPTRAIRRRNQFPRRLLGVVGAHKPGQIRLSDHIGQTIGAQQNHIPGLQIKRREGIHFNLRRGAQRTGDDISLRVEFGFLGCEPAQVNLLLHQRVIARQAVKSALADQISAAIASIDIIEPVPVNCRSYHRGSSLRGIEALQVLTQRSVSRNHGRLQIRQKVQSRRVIVALHSHANRPMAGLAPGSAAAHAIRHDKQLPMLR